MGKYRGKNDKPNDKCEKCSTPIWVRTGIYTVYHGYENWANYPTVNPESVVVMDSRFEVQGPVCWNCFEKMEEENRK